MALLSVSEAQEQVLKRAIRMPPTRSIVSPGILGTVLADDVCSDIDSPPFDKSMVDGYAVRSEDVAAGVKRFRIVEEIFAGQSPTCRLAAGETASIMTGAPIPNGADATVMHEHTQVDESSGMVIIPGPVKRRQNIMARAAEMKQGEQVLAAGSLLRPQELGLLATVGCTGVNVIQRPVVSILSTGDEVVEPGSTLQPGQIRNSNASLLAGLVARSGCGHRYLGIARDTLSSLKPLIARGLEHDVLLITGGVSAGKVDLVPQVLKEAGVEPVFHKVMLKPGKPLYFGTCGRVLVFGLPGNPVSGLVGFVLFVEPALRKLMGRAEPHTPQQVQAVLTHAFQHKSDRPTYYPAKLQVKEGRLHATLMNWKGSGDLRSLCQADSFAVLLSGELGYAAGDLLNVLLPESFL